jgi:hypothetical protein
MSVVVLRVLVSHRGGVVSVIDQDVVGAFGTDGGDEPLGVTVRWGVRGGVMMIVMFSLRNTASKLASQSRMRKRNEVIRSLRSMARLRAAWVTHCPVG